MENWFQHILLTYRVIFIVLAFVAKPIVAQEERSNTVDSSDINSELFEVGLTAGVLNIADFSSEIAAGVSASFNASENFFLQFNWLQADASLSSYEESQGQFFSGNDRQYSHYDLLVGYKIFHGEVFATDNHSGLSSLYLVTGVGDTDFGGETAFTYTIGAGYNIELGRRYILRFDYRSYVYDSSLIKEDEQVHNSLVSTGIGILF